MVSAWLLVQLLAATPVMPGLNTGKPVLDTKTPVLDTGKPVLDTKTPVLDTKTPVLDVGEPDLDVGKPVLDIGKPVLDTEVTVLDTEVTVLDTEVTVLDTRNAPTPVQDGEGSKKDVTLVTLRQGPQDKDVFAHAAPPDGPPRPVPWVKYPFIYLVQMVAGTGLRSLLLPVAAIPVVGPLLLLTAGPVLESLGVAWSGDRLGDGRSSWPLLWLVSGVVGGSGALVMLAANVALVGVLAGVLVLAWPGLLAVVGVPLVVTPALLTLGTGGLVGALAVVMVAQGFGMFLQLLSPMLSTGIYHAVKRTKCWDDDGTGMVGVLPRFGACSPEPQAPPKK